MTEKTRSHKQPQVYRYGGLVVRYHEDRLEPMTREPVAWSRFLPPLPRRLRKAIQKQAREIEQKARFDALNVKLPERKPDSPWTDLTATGASGASA